MSIATPLPTWEQMSERDQAAALNHVWKVYREGRSYAREHYPAEYVNHPALTALDSRAASTHAMAVTGGNDAIQGRLGMDEWDRIYNLAP